MKQTIFLFCVTLFCAISMKAQKIDSIYFNLYTDSLKKGSWNYINVEAKYSDGKVLPLAANQLIFNTTAGKPDGNSIWLDWDFKGESVTVEVKLKAETALNCKMTIPVKKIDLQLNAPVEDSLLRQINNRKPGKQKPRKKS